MEGMSAVGGVFMLAIVILVIVIAVLWILMPFAIFGTKDLLRELVKEQKRTNDLLEQRSRRSEPS